MSERPYHRFVFDVERRAFVGAFEEMYRAEDAEAYDSWFQDDLARLGKRLSLAVLERWNWGSVLDVGCGKGAFTNLLRRENNRVVGLDVSETAVEKARARFAGVEFRVGTVAEVEERFELVVAMEVLSYLEDWRGALARFAELAPALYLTLYLPPDPIGFVKSFAELRAEVGRHYRIETDLMVDSGQLLLFAVAPELRSLEPPGERPHHRYVFDVERRAFVGAFEEMYQAEDRDRFDSSFQDDVTALSRRLSLAVLERWNWGSVLDVGCGKGAFTNLLRRENNRVVGLDVSETAVEKARARFAGVEFRVGTVAEVEERFELVVAMEVLSYLEDWRGALARFAELAPALYLTLYLPPDPIGFVKSFAELRAEVGRHYRIETDIVYASPTLNGEQLLLLARR